MMEKSEIIEISKLNERRQKDHAYARSSINNQHGRKTGYARKRWGGKGGEAWWWWEYCNNDGTNLFIDCVTLSEYEVTTEQPRNEGIMRSLLSLPTPAVQFPLEEKKRLVNCDEFGEVRSMLFRCTQYDYEPLVPTNFSIFNFQIFQIFACRRSVCDERRAGKKVRGELAVSKKKKKSSHW